MNAAKMHWLELVLACLALTADASGSEWVDKYLVAKRTETTERDENGEVKSMTVVTESRIAVAEKITEVRQKGKDGLLKAVSRTTEILDTFGNRTVVVEQAVEGRADLVEVAISAETRNPDGSVVTTTRNLDKHGRMITTQRVTRSRNAQGLETTVVETADKNGNLTVSRTTTQSETRGESPPR